MEAEEFKEQTNLHKVVHGFQIPAKPEFLFKLQETMESQDPSLEDLANIISEDVGLSSAIIKTINSPYYGVGRPVSDIHQAVIYLGAETIQALSRISLLRRSFQEEGGISLERFWDNSVDIAHAMSFVNKKTEHRLASDMVYSLGLFHDCGIPAMSIKFKNYKETLQAASVYASSSIVEIEDQKYNTNHAVVGYLISRTWHLPEALCQAILNHHERDFINHCEDETVRLAYSLLKLSEHIVDRHVRFQENADWPYVKDDVLGVLGMSEYDLEDLEDDYSEMFKETRQENAMALKIA